MATLSSAKQLLALLGGVANEDDPVAAIERQGHQFAPSLKSKLAPRTTVSARKRNAWKKEAAKAGPITFTAGASPQILHRALGPGEFEMSAGVRMATANEILAGLYASGTIPDVLFLDELLSAGDLTALAGGFRVDREGGRIGRLLITAAPTIAPIRDGFGRVDFVLPFRLNFEKVSTVLGGKIRTVVTFATGRFHLSVGIATKAPFALGPRDFEFQIDLSDSADARMEIDPNSPVQRASTPAPGQADGFAIILQNALQLRMADALRLTVSAALPLPLGKLELKEIVLLTRGDALLAGIKVQGTGGAGNPSTLVALFPNAQTNFFTRVHDEVFRLILNSAVRSGELTRIARKTHPDAVIQDADVSFGDGTIRLMASGKIVDLCPLGVDLGFTVTTTIKVTLDGTRIIIDKSTSNDLDNIDAALCILTSLGLALLAAIGVIVFQGLSLASGFAAGAALGVVGLLTLMLEFDGDDFSLVFGGSGDGGPIIIDLDDPIPGTDLLPTLTGMFIRLDESTLLMAAHLGTRPDFVNTYFYVRFLEADQLGRARAMKGASVRLMDRDSPAPAGDDVTLPGPSTRRRGQNTPQGPVEITTETSYSRTPDETFGQATADFSGRVRFYVPRGKLASRAGTKTVKTTRVNLDTDKQTTSTSRTAVAEPQPDFYFRITRPNGSVIDTSGLPAGFFLNFQSKRVGSPANPLTLTFGGVGPVITFNPEVL